MFLICYFTQTIEYNIWELVYGLIVINEYRKSQNMLQIWIINVFLYIIKVKIQLNC